MCLFTCKNARNAFHPLEWNWALGQGGGGQDVKGSSMSKSSPCHNIHEGESSWVIGIGEECDFLGESISSLHVSLSILLWHTSLGQRCTVEWQEHKASQGQGSNSCSSNNKVHIRDSLGGHSSGGFGGDHGGHSNSGRWSGHNHGVCFPWTLRDSSNESCQCGCQYSGSNHIIH